MKKEKKVLEALAGSRLDHFLVANFDLSKSQANRHINNNLVFINAKLSKKNGVKLKEGDVILLDLPEIEKTDLSKLNLPKPNIVYEDEDIIVVDKPAGLTTHRDKNHMEDNMMNRLLASGKKLASLGCPDRCGVVHRLDKDTSGLIIFSKNNQAQQYMQDIFTQRKIKKEYLALCHGTDMPKKGTIDSPIVRDNVDRHKMTVSSIKSAKKAITHFDIMEVFNKTTLLKVNLETGRTHQIRLHLAAISHPICFDLIYGKASADKNLEEGSPRLFLHAHYLSFISPAGQNLSFKSELPADLSKILTNNSKI